MTALYQVAALLRTLDEAAGGGDGAFDTEAIVAEFDGLIMSSIEALEGRAEAEMVGRLLRLREAFSEGVAEEGAEEARADDLAGARADAMHAVDDYFKRMLEGVPSIKAYLDALASEAAPN